MRTRKKDVMELATRQSRRALRVTSALREHGWRHHYDRGERVESDDEYRREAAQGALDFARLVERDAAATRSWVEKWAREWGAS